MSKSYKVGIQLVGPGGQIYDTIQTITDVNDAGFDDTVTAGATNHVINIQFPYANVSLFSIETDHNITAFTNAADGTGGNSLGTITGGVPYVYVIGGIAANPLTHNVTAMYVNVPGGSNAAIKITALFH